MEKKLDGKVKQTRTKLVVHLPREGRKLKLREIVTYIIYFLSPIIQFPLRFFSFLAFFILDFRKVYQNHCCMKLNL